VNARWFVVVEVFKLAEQLFHDLWQCNDRWSRTLPRSADSHIDHTSLATWRKPAKLLALSGSLPWLVVLLPCCGAGLVIKEFEITHLVQEAPGLAAFCIDEPSAAGGFGQTRVEQLLRNLLKSTPVGYFTDAARR
jgi:hypothetical protein